MIFREFKRQMKKAVFSFEEARLVAFATPIATFRLELHQWTRSGDLVRLKRGAYAFSDKSIGHVEIARALYGPSYISLEYALGHYNLLPDVPFAVTLVTTKATRKFNTPFGQFTYQKIPPRAFLGFDPENLIAAREKALVDYLYLNKNRLIPNEKFWREMRWQNLSEINFRMAKKFAQYFESKKVLLLLKNLEEYAKTHPTA